MQTPKDKEIAEIASEQSSQGSNNESDGWTVSSSEGTGKAGFGAAGTGPQNIKQWLHHCVEVESAFKYYEKSQEDHAAALSTILQDPKNKVCKKEDAEVVVTTLDDDAAFDFDSVHHMPLPIQVERFPLVLMMMYKRNESKCFARIKVDLTHFDGVTALHMAFNMLEYLETGSFSPYPFTGSNPALPKHQLDNFNKQLSRMSWEKFRKRLSPTSWFGTWPLQIPFLTSTAEPERTYLRFTEVSGSFKTVMAKIDQAKKLLDLPFYAATVNYTPSITCSLCRSLEEVMDKQKRVDNITFPPVGTGPPPPMDADHTAALFNTLFFNNYGKHEAPRISGKITGHAWDWSGLDSETDFPPVFIVAQIQGKLFLSLSASPRHFDILSKSGILDDIGEHTPFRHRSFYVRGS